MSPLVICEVLGVLVNTFNGHDKRSLFGNVIICWSEFKCNYLENEQLFLNFRFHFWNSHQFLNILKKNIIVTTNVFLEFKTAKEVVRQISKKPRFRTTFDSHQIKG